MGAAEKVLERSFNTPRARYLSHKHHTTRTGTTIAAAYMNHQLQTHHHHFANHIKTVIVVPKVVVILVEYRCRESHPSCSDTCNTNGVHPGRYRFEHYSVSFVYTGHTCGDW